MGRVFGEWCLDHQGYDRGRQHSGGESMAITGLTHHLFSQHSEPVDVAFVMIGYLLMNFAMVCLFLNMRKIGSNLSLGMATLFHGALALASAMVVLSACGVPINLIQLRWVRLVDNSCVLPLTYAYINLQ